VACQLGTHWIGGEVIVYLLRYPDRSTEHRACNRSEVQPTEEATQAAAERSGDRPGAAGHPAPRQPVIDNPRIVEAHKPGSKPYLSLSIPKVQPDQDADRKAKAFLRRLMPNHPMLQDDD
jgi:hypothetical protein